MNEQTQPERIPLGELYRKPDAEQEELEGMEEEEQQMGATVEKRAARVSRLERLEQKKAQLEHQIKSIQARENEKARRERTRRLIQIGAIACKYLNCPDDISPAAFEARMQSMIEALKQQQTPENH